MTEVPLQDLRNCIYRLQDKYSINYQLENLNDRTDNLNILANLINSVLDQDPQDKKVLLTNTVIQGVDFAVCPQDGCNVKYTWNCFGHLKSHVQNDHGFDIVKVRKRRPLDQLKESTKRQYKYCPPKYYDDQKEQLKTEITKLSPVNIDGQEYYVCPTEGCQVKYTANSFRLLKKHVEKEHSFEVSKERKRRPLDQLKESTKRQYKYCPPKHYEDRVKIDEPQKSKFGSEENVNISTHVNETRVAHSNSFLKVVTQDIV